MKQATAQGIMVIQ